MALFFAHVQKDTDDRLSMLGCIHGNQSYKSLQLTLLLLLSAATIVTIIVVVATVAVLSL